LPLKKELSAFQPVFAVYVSPAVLAQIIVTSLTINSGAVALAGGANKNDVPNTRSNTLSFLLVSLAKKEVNLVNAGFQPFNLIFD
jgi:hypothetical protein